jgi:N-acetylglucosaminyldiphosphoundecaprenol N-acetyl-beta-D-mannosaminyltransferase
MQTNKDLNLSLSRDTYCILGLPFDALDLYSAQQVLLKNIAENRRCFLSTPNLNWLRMADTDSSFLESALNSDCLIADGAPIIWAARLLNIPLPERAAGSDLITKLEEFSSNKKTRIFFFGGMDNVGDQACVALNNKNSNLEAVGSYNPGFGSIEDMSDDSIIEYINSTNPDFIIVSLGANKGQKWIEHNMDNLNAPIISHLGAVINFYAGTVDRAPRWSGTLGMEWLWRIYQEPKLYTRYFQDGLFLIKQTLQRLLPYWLFLKLYAPKPEATHGNVKIISTPSCQTIHLAGSFSQANIGLLKEALITTSEKYTDIIIDLKDTKYIDSAVTGALLLFKKYCNTHGLRMSLINTPNKIAKIFYFQKVEYLTQ